MENERVAKLELRADKADETFGEIRAVLKDISSSLKELVRVQVATGHLDDRITRLEKQIEQEREQRRNQHEETREWAERADLDTKVNTSWVQWGKTILISLLVASTTVGLTHLLTSMAVAS